MVQRLSRFFWHTAEANWSSLTQVGAGTLFNGPGFTQQSI